MAQQFHNGGGHKGDVTVSNRDSARYAIINPPFSGKHAKPQTVQAKLKRKMHWKLRHA